MYKWRKENYFNNNKINNDIVKYIINKNNNYDNVGIKIKMKNSCSIDKGNNYSKSIRLLNIIYKWEDGAISNDPPATIIGLEVPPVNDIRKYIISSIINIVIKNNNIQDIIKTTQPLIIIRTNLGIQITNLNIVMKVGILNFINAIIVSIVSLIAIINSGAKFIFNSEYEQAIIGVIAAAILTINLVYLGTRLARIFGKK